MKKVDDFETVYDMIEHAIELAFDGKMQLKFYQFLEIEFGLTCLVY